jgi:putative membrane protein insertion efficiency factor
MSRRYIRFVRRVARFPAQVLLALVWLYQRTLSPALPALFGPACGCRFHPTCSHYAAEAVRAHGALAGLWLAVRRLLRCHPLGSAGLDPVPPARRPRCVRLTA